MGDMKAFIESGKAVLGIDMGSTRIKAVVIDEQHNPVISGGYGWENRLVDGVWTYTMEDFWNGLQGAYADLVKNIKEEFDAEVTSFKSIGISAMMHGYLPFDKDGNLIAMYRTWRNTLAHDAAEQLTEMFQYNVPDRFSGSHLYHSVLKEEEHLSDLDYLTTLSGYIHWQLTGEKVIGIGDASGIFPVSSVTKDFRWDLLDKLQEKLNEKNYPWTLKSVLPKVLVAGDAAGCLTEEGAKKLDVSGKLKAGIPMCPPEGDAGTGMVATNSVAQRTGNISMGTSGFLMIVMENDVKSLYREVEPITTPDGSTVAMVHANNCTTDVSAWVTLFGEFAKLAGADISVNDLYTILYKEALKGDADCGGNISYNYHAGEFITRTDEGRPLYVRMPDAAFTLANFMRTQIYGTLATIRMGVEILEKENVEMDSLIGHGGLFKTEGVAQKFLADAMKCPVAVMETAGEGGAWGIALLAAFMAEKEEGEKLPEFLNKKVFASANASVIEPDQEGMDGFDRYMELYKAGFAAERAAGTEMR